MFFQPGVVVFSTDVVVFSTDVVVFSIDVVVFATFTTKNQHLFFTILTYIYLILLLFY
jgi:hypothetical protein